MVYEINDYSEYSKIENHIYYSKKLYTLNKIGKHILNEIATKKTINGRKKLLSSVYKVYHKLNTIIKPNILCNNIYSSLVYYLDELLFLEVKNLNKFVIEDDTYPLSYLYFNCDDWVTDEIQKFSLDSSIILRYSEAMLISCYLDNYEEFILRLEVDIKKSYYIDLDHKLIKKLMRIFARLKKRLIILKVMMLKIIDIELKSIH